MGLYDQIKELDEELEEGAEGAAEGEEEEVDLGPAKEEEAEPEAAEEATEEPAKPKEAAPAAAAAVAKTPGSDPEMARLRREKDAADRRARMAEQALAQRQAPAQPQPAATATKPAVVADPEPDKATNYEGWLEWNLRQTQRANEELRGTVEGLNKWKETTEQKSQRETAEMEEKRAFLSLESQFAPTVPDYKDVTEWGWNQLAHSIKMLNPRMNAQQIHQETNNRILAMAQDAAARGEHPIEALYNHAKSSGYQPKPAPVAEVETPVKPAAKLKPDLKKVSESQKKSGSALSGGGKSGKPPLSKEHVASSEFGFKDFLKLTPSELHELESMA